jgi:hypothetical protein
MVSNSRVDHFFVRESLVSWINLFRTQEEIWAAGIATQTWHSTVFADAKETQIQLLGPPHRGIFSSLKFR